MTILHCNDRLSLFEQKNLVKFYLGIKDLMYTPRLKSGKYMSLEMFCLGKHWNPVDYKYYNTRIDHDSLNVPAIHPYLSQIAERYCEKYCPKHIPQFDVCIVNYYHPAAKLGWHSDNSETLDTLKSGHPILSISVGADANFQVKSKNNETTTYLLKSGDIIIMSDDDRLASHRIQKILDPNAFSKFLKNGRVNFTFRKL